MCNSSFHWIWEVKQNLNKGQILLQSHLYTDIFVCDICLASILYYIVFGTVFWSDSFRHFNICCMFHLLLNVNGKLLMIFNLLKSYYTNFCTVLFICLEFYLDRIINKAEIFIMFFPWFKEISIETGQRRKTVNCFICSIKYNSACK